MHHKVHLRDDARIDSVIFFEDELVIAAHVKKLKIMNTKKGGHDQDDRGSQLEAFKLVKSLEELVGEKSQFAQEELLIFKIFDRIKVRVDTTTEFPLDIKCTLIFGSEDLEDYSRQFAEQEAAKQAEANLSRLNSVG